MKVLRKVICFLIATMMVSLLAACGVSEENEKNEEIEEIINYADAESFETALNNGENLEGKIVQFIAGDLKPDSDFGYNIWAGEHLNFVSSRNPDVKRGDIIVVKATTIERILGSWIIKYEKVDNAVIDDTTILYSPGPPEQPLELVDYGWYVSPSFGDTTYVDFCGMIHNPNEKLIAKFPKVIVTVKNSEGSIIATEEQTGSFIMPQDTITLCGMFSVPNSCLTEDIQYIFDVDWSDLQSETLIYSEAKTTDFEIINVSEIRGSDSYITGTITGESVNNYSEAIGQVNLSVVFRKDGEIVYIEHTFLDNLKVGEAKAFQLPIYDDWTEHDSVDISAMVW